LKSVIFIFKDQADLLGMNGPQDPVVVTAFYPLTKSKHGVAKYIPWLQLFCKIPCRLVVFTDASMEGQIREWRGSLMDHTVIVTRPFESYRMTTPAMMDMWRRHHLIDPERGIHSPELYAVWAMKQECVREAFTIIDGPTYIWCDMGILRDPLMLPYYMTFPRTDACVAILPAGRLTFLEVSMIPESFVERWRFRQPVAWPVPSVTLGGGCIAGDRAAWTEFGAAYEATLADFDAAGRFNGKDQIVYFAMLMERKLAQPYRLLAARRFAGGSGDHWMCMPVILGGKEAAAIDHRFEST
jgi:hypothetical protein